MAWVRYGIAGILALHAPAAYAATPEEIFERVSPSIVVIEVRDYAGQPLAFGSGVIVGEVGASQTMFGADDEDSLLNFMDDLSQVATNCHVAKAGPVLAVKYQGKKYPAAVLFQDTVRDLCILKASGIPYVMGTSVRFAREESVRTGARVYAIGAPEGLEMTISEGLVSGLRPLPDGSTLIQTTAPISPGSSGGGLFNSEGELVGITTAYLAEGQNLNFAVPSKWILEAPNRSRTVDAKKRQRDLDIAASGSLDWDALDRYVATLGPGTPQEVIAGLRDAIAFGRIAGKRQEVYRALTRVLQRDVSNGPAWLYQGSVQLVSEDYVLAEISLKAATALLPHNEAAWFNLALVYLDAPNTEAFKPVYLKLKSEWPDRAKQVEALARELDGPK